ncbi:LexA family protein [Selenomonas flueggei]|uniref:LexA family protein n=1 Tax=Selenomonas flueggei TaxID=135080 RepID=UPI0026723CC8|nr:S24 family peptidase [Selenomonas flueggei]
MTVGSRIREFRKRLGLSVDDVAEKLKKNRATIYRYESDDIENLPAPILEPLAKVLQTTPAELMGWEQSPVPASDDLPDLPNIFPIQTKKVPLLGTIAAGVPIYADENFDGYRECTEDIDADFCLKIQGDSMIGARINDGDIVFIKKQPDVDNGEIAAVLIENEATLKRVYKEKDSLILQAENPKYAPIVYTAESYVECRILGKAVTFQSDIT